MEETIWSGMGIILFVVAIIWLIVTLNRKINKALKKSAEILNFETDIPRNILRKKKIFGELVMADPLQPMFLSMLISLIA